MVNTLLNFSSVLDENAYYFEGLISRPLSSQTSVGELKIRLWGSFNRERGVVREFVEEVGDNGIYLED